MSDTTGVVVFNYAGWIVRFPEFTPGPDEPLATRYFNDATLFLDNTASSQVADLTQREQLLWLLTAHIAKLSGWPGAASGGSGAVGGGLVGPITSATEGSVSVSVAQLAGANASALQAWLSQTQYGAMYYAMTAAYRMARYYPGRQPYLGVGPRFIGRGGWYGW
jgi:hypothetical protein